MIETQPKGHRRRIEGAHAGRNARVAEVAPAGPATPAGATDWARLDRFLTLGAECGAYRVGSSGLEPDGTESTVRCIRSDARRVVSRVLEILNAGQLAPNGAGIRVLALVTALGDDDGRSAACAGVPRICRTAGDLFHFAERVTALRGWGRGLRRAVGDWYRTRFADDLAYQVVKCPRREGWSHRDLLRLAHPTPATREQAAVFRWILGGPASLGRRTVVREVARRDTESCGEVVLGEGTPAHRTYRAVTYPGVGELPRLLRGLEEAKRVSTAVELVRLVLENDLPREAIPVAWLEDLSVWEALLHRMPLGAMIRDLGRLSAVGLVAPGSEAAWWVETRLRDPGVLRGSGLHPMAFLLARRAYETGAADCGRVRWVPVPAVVRALDDAFYAAFRNVRPVGRSMLVALDLSESTRSTCLPGTTLTVREAAAAMALITVSTEARCLVAGLTSTVVSQFTGTVTATSGLRLLDILPGLRLEEVVARLAEIRIGIPDGALPMVWAGRHRLPIECFVTYTDGEAWGVAKAPADALRGYRDATGIPARWVLVGMAGSGFELADAGDPGMLDVHGFDASTADVIAGYLRDSGDDRAHVE